MFLLIQVVQIALNFAEKTRSCSLVRRLSCELESEMRNRESGRLIRLASVPFRFCQFRKITSIPDEFTINSINLNSFSEMTKLNGIDPNLTSTCYNRIYQIKYNK